MRELAVTAARAERFDPDARAYEAFRLGDGTTLLGKLAATTIDQACGEATERWAWDRGDRLGIRETGEEEARQYPFERRPFDRLHIYAVQRSAPLRWQLDKFGNSKPVYRYSLKPVCVVDLPVVTGSARNG